MAETADYDPGPWSGYDFKSARATYDAYAGRSYTDAVSKGIVAESLVPEALETDSDSPLVIACDVTGSMGEWPATIFSKLPYLDLEGKEYLGENMQISFAAIGDVYSDRYPLQVQPFVKGKELEASLKKLVIEKGGGGSTQESYDVGALYYARNAKMPNAIKPIFIFIGDEGLYDNLPSDLAESVAKSEVDKRASVEQIIDELKQKFAVYLIRKPYGSDSTNSTSPTDRRIQEQWEKLLGEDHVCILPEAGRVVDVIFGILAKETGKTAYFKKEIEDRQEEKQVKVVMKSLATIHNKSKSLKKLTAGASITKRNSKKKLGDGKKTISLVDD